MSPLRLRLTIFVAIAVIAVGYTGARYAQVTDWIASTDYRVKVELPTSGGIFPGAQVTYRGVPIGRVSGVTLTPSGVQATMAISSSWHVPADVIANVEDRSVVGEQYLDLVPRTGSGPALKDGSTIQAGDTTTPVPTEELIQNLDSLVKSVGPTNLRTVVTELGTAFGGRGAALATILSNTSQIVERASANLSPTLQLVNNTDTVLATQVAGGSDIQSFAHSLALFTTTVRQGDSAFRGVLSTGPGLAQDLSALIRALSGPLPPLLTNLIELNAATIPNLHNLGFGLAIAPWDVAAVEALVRNGRSYLGLSANALPQVCQKGYIPSSQWRSANDLSIIPAPKGPHCAEQGKNYRGSAAGQ